MIPLSRLAGGALAAGIVIMLFRSFVSKWLAASPVPFPYTSSTPQPPLRLSADNDFHIAIFSDLHFGENEDSFGIGQDIGSLRVMNSILDAETLDFVVINGDLITGENTFLFNSSTYVDVIVAPLVQHNVPWASTYGNHDSQFNLSRASIFAREQQYALSYTQHSPPNLPGITNYYLPIFPPVTSPESDIPIAILWFFDSQGGFPYQEAPSNTNTLPDYVTPSIVSWYQSAQSTLQRQYSRTIPSLAFVHIPPSAFASAQSANITPANFPGLNADDPLAFEGDGTQDGEFVTALAQAEGLHSVYSGHDHGDSWCANWPADGTVGSDAGDATRPHLCFGKHTGYGGYGAWKRGSRIVKLTFGVARDMKVETWVRMESGLVIQKVGLNSTYGVDVYPTDDGEDGS